MVLLRQQPEDESLYCKYEAHGSEPSHTTAELAGNFALHLRVMGVDPTAAWWSRLPGLFLFLFICSVFLYQALVMLGADLPGIVDTLGWISSLGSALAWVFCLRAHRHVDLTKHSDRVRTRLLTIELLMFVASMILVVTLLAAHSTTLLEGVTFLLLAMAIAIPYNVFVSLLQVECVVYEEQMEYHLDQIEAARPQVLTDLKDMLRQGEDVFTLGLVVNSLICSLLLIVNIVLVLHGKNHGLRVSGNVGVSFFYTVVLTSQLVPVAILNYKAQEGAKTPLCSLDALVSAENAEFEVAQMVRSVVKLSAWSATPPVLCILNITITPAMLIEAFLSITLGNLAAVAYHFLRENA